MDFIVKFRQNHTQSPLTDHKRFEQNLRQKTPIVEKSPIYRVLVSAIIGTPKRDAPT